MYSSFGDVRLEKWNGLGGGDVNFNFWILDDFLKKLRFGVKGILGRINSMLGVVIYEIIVMCRVDTLLLIFLVVIYSSCYFYYFIVDERK